jgi:uncharacterized protein YmfQ (DUF2313 family)
MANSRHYEVLKKLFPVPQLGGGLDVGLDVEGLNLDSAEDFSILLMKEVLPTTATNDADLGLISQWEKLLGIVPDDSRLIGDRRAEVIAKLTAPPGINEAFYYAIASSLGYNIFPSVTDPHVQILKGVYRPFRVGYGQIGIDPVYDQSAGFSQFTWKITGTNVESDSILRSIFNDLKPACSEVVFEDS